MKRILFRWRKLQMKLMVARCKLFHKAFHVYNSFDYSKDFISCHLCGCHHSKKRVSHLSRGWAGGED